MQLSRRELFKYAAVGSAALGAAALTSTTPAVASPGLGILIDYSGGVPDATAIGAAGYVGAIRYVSAAPAGRSGVEALTRTRLFLGECRHGRFRRQCPAAAR